MSIAQQARALLEIARARRKLGPLRAAHLALAGGDAPAAVEALSRVSASAGALVALDACASATESVDAVDEVLRYAGERLASVRGHAGWLPRPYLEPRFHRLLTPARAGSLTNIAGTCVEGRTLLADAIRRAADRDDLALARALLGALPEGDLAHRTDPSKAGGLAPASQAVIALAEQRADLRGADERFAHAVALAEQAPGVGALARLVCTIGRRADAAAPAVHDIVARALARSASSEDPRDPLLTTHALAAAAQRSRDPRWLGWARESWASITPSSACWLAAALRVAEGAHAQRDVDVLDEAMAALFDATAASGDGAAELRDALLETTLPQRARLLERFAPLLDGPPRDLAELDRAFERIDRDLMGAHRDCTELAIAALRLRAPVATWRRLEQLAEWVGPHLLLWVSLGYEQLALEDERTRCIDRVVGRPGTTRVIPSIFVPTVEPAVVDRSRPAGPVTHGTPLIDHAATLDDGNPRGDEQRDVALLAALLAVGEREPALELELDRRLASLDTDQPELVPRVVSMLAAHPRACTPARAGHLARYRGAPYPDALRVLYPLLPEAAREPFARRLIDTPDTTVPPTTRLRLHLAHAVARSRVGADPAAAMRDADRIPRAAWDELELAPLLDDLVDVAPFPGRDEMYARWLRSERLAETIAVDLAQRLAERGEHALFRAIVEGWSAERRMTALTCWLRYAPALSPDGVAAVQAVWELASGDALAEQAVASMYYALAKAGRHQEARELRRLVGNLPGYRMVEYRHRHTNGRSHR